MAAPLAAFCFTHIVLLDHKAKECHMFQVLTHNGRLPKDGGIRVGYRTDNKVFLFGGPSSGFTFVTPKQEATKVAAAVVAQAPSMRKARRSLDSKTVFCPHCDGINSVS